MSCKKTLNHERICAVQNAVLSGSSVSERFCGISRELTFARLGRWMGEHDYPQHKENPRRCLVLDFARVDWFEFYSGIGVAPRYHARSDSSD
jgi:hypothetical protein